MIDDVLRRLEALDLTLPTPPKPLGSYRAVVEAGRMLHVSMQGPVVVGRQTAIGVIGGAVSPDEGRDAAKYAALNALAQVHRHLSGFERVKQIVRLDGYVACVDDFTNHPFVLDGASELIAALFGDRAGHARTVGGLRNLPGNLPVAVALTVEIAAAGTMDL